MLEPDTVTIGVCEDDDELRGILRDVLQRAGMTVRPTVSGAEAVEIFTARPPDLLILDIGLPDADGRDVCQALRARGVTIPVLFLTARGSVTERVSGFNAGGDDYLTKPFALAELLVRVGALLRRRAPEDPPADPPAFVLDPGRHALRHDDRETSLTRPNSASSRRSRRRRVRSCATRRSSARPGPRGRACTTTRCTSISGGSAAS